MLEPLHLVEAYLIGCRFRVFVVKSKAPQPRARCGLNSILEGKWTDLDWPQRIDVARKLEVGDQQFDVMTLSGSPALKRASVFDRHARVPTFRALRALPRQVIRAPRCRSLASFPVVIE